MYLIIIRHGQAHDGEEDDFRQLTELGREQIKEAGLWLKKNLDMFNDISEIYHSGKLRAEQTAIILKEILELTTSLVPLEILQPNVSPGALIDKLHEMNNNAIMVGHLPHVRDFAYEILGFQNTQLIDKMMFHTGTVVVLRRAENYDWRVEDCFEPSSS